MLSRLPLLLIPLLLAGCGFWPPPPTAPADPAAALFDRGLEQLYQDQRPEALQQLQQLPPANPWNRRAQLLLKVQQRNERQRREQRQALQRQKALEKQLAERDAYIQQLKDLIIRNESNR